MVHILIERHIQAQREWKHSPLFMRFLLNQKRSPYWTTDFNETIATRGDKPLPLNLIATL